MKINIRPSRPAEPLERGKNYEFAWMPRALGERDGKVVRVWWVWYIVEHCMEGIESYLVDYPVGSLHYYPIGDLLGYTPYGWKGVSLARYYREKSHLSPP